MCRYDMDKLQYNLHQMELKSEKPRKDLTDEVQCIKEDAVLRIDLQAWADDMEDSISPIFTNLLGRLQGMEGRPSQEGFTHRAKDMLQKLE